MPPSSSETVARARCAAPPSRTCAPPIAGVDPVRSVDRAVAPVDGGCIRVVRAGWIVEVDRDQTLCATACRAPRHDRGDRRRTLLASHEKESVTECSPSLAVTVTVPVASSAGVYFHVQVPSPLSVNAPAASSVFSMSSRHRYRRPRTSRDDDLAALDPAAGFGDAASSTSSSNASGSQTSPRSSPWHQTARCATNSQLCSSTAVVVVGIADVALGVAVVVRLVGVPSAGSCRCRPARRRCRRRGRRRRRAIALVVGLIGVADRAGSCR